MADVVRLVCEGACNPDLWKLDMMRRAARDTRDLPAAWHQAMRQLQHTPHEPRTGPLLTAAYACTVCGTIRRW